MSDEELIERARGGDHEAFGELVLRYQQVVFRTALVALRSHDDAEDVAQDTFVSAFTKLDTFRGEASFKTWLLSITWNRARDRRRRASEWLRRFVSRDESPGFDPAAPSPSHEATLILDEAKLEVRKLVSKLPAKYRDPLLLSSTGDHSFEEIAAMLGVPTGTAKWRAMEGRRLLKRKLEGKALTETTRPAPGRRTPGTQAVD